MKNFARFPLVMFCPLLLASCLNYDPNQMGGSSSSRKTTYDSGNSQPQTDNSDSTVKTPRSRDQGEITKDLEQADTSGLNVFQECDSSNSGKMVANLYKISEEVTRLPNFADLRSYGTVCFEQLNISPRPFEEGFPGYPNLVTFFALDIKFNLQVEGGEFLFVLNSDNGSTLSIDGELVIDNDGRHDAAKKEGKKVLAAGNHKVQVQYFQADGDIALELMWQKPGDAVPVAIPLSAISKP